MDRTSAKFILVVVSVLLSVILVFGCAGPDATSTEPDITPTTTAEPKVSEWHIPFTIFQSGMFAGQGAIFIWVVEQAAADVNAAGGIRGLPVVIDSCDSAYEATKSVACISKAIDSNALVSIGPIGEVELVAVMPLCEREGFLAMNMLGNEAKVKEFLEWQVWMGLRDEDTKYTTQMWLEAEPDIESVVCITHPEMSKNIEAWKWREQFLKEMGITIKERVEVSVTAVDFGPAAIRAIASGANAFVIEAIPDTSSRILKELVDRGADPTNIFIQRLALDATFMKDTAQHNEGVYVEDSLTYPYKDKWVKLQERLDIAMPGQFLPVEHYAVYDAVWMIKAAIEQQRLTGDPAKVKEERIAIRDYIQNQDDFDGCKFTYDMVDGLIVRPIYLFQIHNNDFELISKWEP